MKRLALVAALCLPTATFADDFAPSLEAYMKANVLGWAQNPIVIDAIRAQNAVTAGYDQAQVLDLDRQWQAAVSAPETPLIADVLGTAASDYLRSLVTETGGTVAEIIVMDARGLNVAITEVTSDYWQGDEDKHAKSYGMGSGAYFVDEVEFDESAQTYMGQVSVAVTDPDTNAVIGAITVGLDAEALM